MHGKSDDLKTVLVVDDSGMLRNQLTGLLQKFGYGTMAAKNGLDGLEILEKNSEIDLVIADVVMPEMSGREMIKKIRASGKHRNLPLLILTSAEHLEMVTECLDAGADDFLIKPLNPRLMFQRVQNLIENTPRTYNRVPCNVFVEITPGLEIVTGEIIEIGEGGAGIFAKEKLTKGDVVKITFTLPRQSDELDVGGEVIYVQEVPGGWTHGLRFVILDGESRGHIMKFVQDVVSAGDL